MSNIDRNPATGEVWSWQPPKPKPAEPAPPRARKAEELASRLTTFDGYRGNTDGEAAAHLRALDASHQRLVEALEQAKNFIIDETDKFCPDFILEALEQAKDLS